MKTKRRQPAKRALAAPRKAKARRETPATTAPRAGAMPLRAQQAFRRLLSAKYDLAQTTDDNYKHWANADELSPDAALSDGIRRTVRMRCRYEVANNSWAKGIGLTIANDTVGTGPTLQMLGLSRADKKRVETAFWKWSQEVQLARKLRLMRFARYDSGECFMVFETNPGLRNPVKLDAKLVEAEQIADPMFSPPGSDMIDGIAYDDHANPVTYRKLRAHPGAFDFAMPPAEYDDIAAEFVWHYFRADRPGQLRGIPDLTPAGQLFAELRRYSNAVIAAAETAADFAMVLQSDAPPADPTDEEATTSEYGSPFDTIELVRRMATMLPKGWALNQTKAEQPTTSYGEFVDAKIKEIARCLCVPFHIASLDPSMANMSSSYVVGQFYAHERLVDRDELEWGLDRVFAIWLEEAKLVADLLPEIPDDATHLWGWPSLGHHADPVKVANARKINLASGVSSIAREYMLEGLDWEEQQELAAKTYGKQVEEYRELVASKTFAAGGSPTPGGGGSSGGGGGPDEDEEEPDDEQETQSPATRNGNRNNGRSVARRQPAR